MNAALFLIIGVAVLIVGYIFYGGWLAKKWGVDNSRVTPAHELEDGKDYCPAKAPVLMGHHFSSIAGAGPINGPIQAAVFGWVPVMLWVLIGGIFFGGGNLLLSVFVLTLSSLFFILAASTIAAPCSPPFAIRASPSARSSATPSAPGPRSCSSSSRT